MLRHFLGSYIITIVGLIFAYLWGEHVHSGTGLICVFIAFVLSVLEISLSFDNAVVNAMKLERMSEKWQHRFLTWGILIAVFGMRFLFPVLVVTAFARLNPITVVNIALNDSLKYAHYLHQTHAPIVAFGGAFLMMLFLSYFFNSKKDVHWIKPLEQPLAKVGDIKGIEVLIVLICLGLVQFEITSGQKLSVIFSAIIGIVTYLVIDGISAFLESKEQSAILKSGSGLAGFLYLELIDASFSLDGVLGAFALSTDIVIITIGLAIGAMFVRSLTLLMVEKKTLAKFLYLEHGAHWAIGVLAIIMFISTFKEVPEVVTGLSGLILIVAAFISSILHNKRGNLIV